ncbi:MAG: hypothetical protein KDI38_03715 [Calditrichaeota bacterium]|nr:hypothetical protein [Calditrichota bacterium]
MSLSQVLVVPTATVYSQRAMPKQQNNLSKFRTTINIRFYLEKNDKQDNFLEVAFSI